MILPKEIEDIIINQKSWFEGEISPGCYAIGPKGFQMLTGKNGWVQWKKTKNELHRKHKTKQRKNIKRFN